MKKQSIRETKIDLPFPEYEVCIKHIIIIGLGMKVNI
jgi:hypothetical protein